MEMNLAENRSGEGSLSILPDDLRTGKTRSYKRIYMPRGQALSCRVICVLLVVFLFHVSSHGQVTTGTLLGTVQDPSGAAIHGAKVTATNLQTGLTRSALSSEDGGYAINLLPVGLLPDAA